MLCCAQGGGLGEAQAVYLYTRGYRAAISFR